MNTDDNQTDQTDQTAPFYVVASKEPADDTLLRAFRSFGVNVLVASDPGDGEKP